MPLSTYAPTDFGRTTSAADRVVYPARRLPTDVQAESVPLILGGGDVLMVRSLHACGAT